MSEYLITFAFAERVSGTRTFEVGVDVYRDFEHLALLVTTIDGDHLSQRRGRRSAHRDEGLADHAVSLAEWAHSCVSGGSFDAYQNDSRRIEIPAAVLVTVADSDLSGSRCQPDQELLRFTA